LFLPVRYNALVIVVSMRLLQLTGRILIYKLKQEKTNQKFQSNHGAEEPQGPSSCGDFCQFVTVRW